MSEDKKEQPFLQADIQALRGQVASLRRTVRELLAREEQLNATVMPNPFEGETSDERILNLEQKIAALGQGREPYKPVLLPERQFFLAHVTNEGPNSEADYTDERYWVKEQRLSNTEGANTTDLTFENHGAPRYVTATNLAELVTVAHELDVDETIKVLVTFSYDQQPKRRYYFYSTAGLADPVDPEQINPVPEGTETADTDTWDREEPAEGKDGVKIKVITRVVYDHTSHEKLYGFWRELTLDRFGRLADITGETRYEIDIPVACP